MGEPHYQLIEDARGGVILSSRCCGFICETGRMDDALFIRRAFMLRPKNDVACPVCGKGRPMEAMGGA
jgi:hypothetical protein